MAFTEFEQKRNSQLVGKYVQSRRPAPHIRPELDFGFRFSGQSFVIFEIRPVWRGEPGAFMEHPVAKATYVKSRKVWKLYWQRADLKWHRYDPEGTADTLEEVLAIVDRDQYGCFYG